jgi:hypothetical protein
VACGTRPREDLPAGDGIAQHERAPLGRHLRPAAECPACGLHLLVRHLHRDYFGIDSDGTSIYTTSVSTYDGGANPWHYQQQLVAKVAIP